ncbi:MAG: flagellar export chaperone FlgN [Burkholderiales bacterium]|nr:flagellar export chaperone FlgN [Burkholderiales bacterium]
MQTSSFNPMASLRAEHQAMSELLVLMQQEQAHLVSADAESLARLTEQKTQLINRAADLARQRHAALEQAGFAGNEASLVVG